MLNKQHHEKSGLQTYLLNRTVGSLVALGVIIVVLSFTAFGKKSPEERITTSQIVQVKNGQNQIVVKEFHGTLQPYQNTLAGPNGHIVLVPVKMPLIKSSEGGTIEVTLPWQCNTFVLTGSSDTNLGPVITFKSEKK